MAFLRRFLETRIEQYSKTPMAWPNSGSLQRCAGCFRKAPRYRFTRLSPPERQHMIWKTRSLSLSPRM